MSGMGLYLMGHQSMGQGGNPVINAIVLGLLIGCAVMWPRWVDRYAVKPTGER